MDTRKAPKIFLKWPKSCLKAAKRGQKWAKVDKNNKTWTKILRRAFHVRDAHFSLVYLWLIISRPGPTNLTRANQGRPGSIFSQKEAVQSPLMRQGGCSGDSPGWFPPYGYFSSSARRKGFLQQKYKTLPQVSESNMIYPNSIWLDLSNLLLWNQFSSKLKANWPLHNFFFLSLSELVTRPDYSCSAFRRFLGTPSVLNEPALCGLATRMASPGQHPPTLNPSPSRIQIQAMWGSFTHMPCPAPQPPALQLLKSLQQRLPPQSATPQYAFGLRDASRLLQMVSQVEPLGTLLGGEACRFFSQTNEGLKFQRIR